MNSHKNARLTLEVRKWQRRFEEGGQGALRERSSRPERTRSTVDDALARRIEQLRRARMLESSA